MLFDATKKFVHLNSVPKRWFFGALNAVFNSVSPSRIKLVGPDRACAEWLMRNGAHIRWVGQEDFVTHYDSLPLDVSDNGIYHIEEIYAKDASISHHGFPHFKGCNHLKRMTLNNCGYIDDKCVESFSYVKDSLENLDIRTCRELTQNGLLKFGDLKLDKLVCFRLGNMLKPEALLEVIQDLQKALPNCDVKLLPEE